MATAPKAAPSGTSQGGAIDNAAAPKSGKKKLLIIGLAVALLAGGGAGAFFALKKSGHDTAGTPPPKKAEAPKPPVFLTLETFTVNLQRESDAADKYLQVNISLQVTDQTQVDLLKQFMPLLRSRILLLLSGKKSSEISTAEGKQKLQDEIIAVANKPLVPTSAPQEVNGVFFTSFVIQ